jgi:hypothetical protein
MKAIVKLTQKPYKYENGNIRQFPEAIIYLDETSKFPYQVIIPSYGNGVWERSKKLKTLVKRLNTYIYCITYRKGKYLAEKTIGSNIEWLDDSFKKELI